MRVWDRLFRHDVFISYGGADEPWVEELARDLRTADVEVFFAPWSLQAGDPWMKQLYRALRTCPAGIVVLSPESVASPFVQCEILVLVARAQEERVPLVPVFHRDVEVPRLLSAYQGIDFRDRTGDAYATSLEGLVRAVRPGSGARWRRLMTQRMLVLLMLVFPMLATLGAAWLRIHLDSGTFARLQATQRDVQALDERVARLQAGPAAGSAGGELVYHDVQAPQWRVVDRRVGGVLRWRYFYRGGRLVARDRFEYDGGMPVEKVREYLDGRQRVFLTDRFDRTGALLDKLHCPRGVVASCRAYGDEMRSPLPPPVPVYR